MRINFTDVDSGSYEALPSGVYHVKVTDVESRTSGENAKHPGSEYFNWEFTIQRGDAEERRLWDNTSYDHGECDCSEEETFNKALFKLKQLIEATEAYTPEELAEEDFEFDPDEVLGKDCNVVVGQRPGQDGEPQNVIKRYKPISAEELANASLLP
jgi:hypothetical protein